MEDTMNYKNKYMLCLIILLVGLAGCGDDKTADTDVDQVETPVRITVESVVEESATESEETEDKSGDEVSPEQVQADTTEEKESIEDDSKAQDSEKVNEEATEKVLIETDDQDKVENPSEVKQEEIAVEKDDAVSQEESQVSASEAADEESLEDDMSSKPVEEPQAVTEQTDSNEVETSDQVQSNEAEVPVETEEVADLNDGTFKAQGKSYDGYGWKGSLSITFEKGAVTKVAYDEVNASGARKSQDTDYLAYYKEQTGVDLNKVYSTLENSLLKGQSPDQVDTVSGATVASQSFKDLAREIYEK